MVDFSSTSINRWKINKRRKLEETKYDVAKKNALYEELFSFINSIYQQDKAVVTAEEALESLKVANKIQKKLKNNVYYIIAGEPSGDLHGRSLIKEIKKLDSSAKFLGLGGPLMQEVGLETSVDFKRLSVMGFFEVLKDIRFFFKTKKKYYSIYN